MVISEKNGKQCLKELGRICPPEIRGNAVEVYGFLEGLDLTVEERHMMNRIWMDYLHGTENE